MIRAKAVAGAALLLALSGLASPSGIAVAAATPPGASVSVTIEPARSNVEPGQLAWTVRIANRSDHRLTGLRLGESVTVNGNPGFGTTKTVPGGGSCGAAAGTTYCSLPPLAGHAVLRLRRTANIPVSMSGISNIGKDLVLDDFVVNAEGATLGASPRQTSRITATLPFTGFPLGYVTLLAGLLVLIGIVLLRSGRLPRSTRR